MACRCSLVGPWCVCRYAQHGIPYRRGYLFSGPPGTGKTSLVNLIRHACLWT